MDLKSGILAFLRRDFRSLVIIAVILASASFIIGRIADHRPVVVDVRPEFLQGSLPRAQAGISRIWKQYAFERLSEIDSTKLTKPMILRVDSSGNAYVLDWDDFRIKAFSTNGNLVKTFGEAKNSGNSGFRNPSSFCVTPNGDVWVCDPILRKIVQFDAHGRLVQTVEPKKALDRISITGDKLVGMVPPGDKNLFDVYSLSGEWLSSFGEIITDQDTYGIALDGGVIDDGGMGFIYGGRNLGILEGYSADGETRFSVRTIDDVPMPTITVIDGKKRKLKPNSPTATLSLSLVGDRIYALNGSSDSPEGAASGQIVDVYNRQDGSYQFSFKLPITCREANIRSNQAYTLGQNGVTIWRFAPAG